jgi:hypothetical protein
MLRFLGIGAQKAGTTWLYEQLRRHPALSFPRDKEAHFWNFPHTADEVVAYLAAFGGEGVVAGEITPAYAILPVATIREIQDQAPALRLIYLLRNPIERAWSAARMDCQRAGLAVTEATAAWFSDHFHSAESRMRGDYAACLRHWLGVFPAEQLLVLRFEQILSEPEALLDRCFAHLGVPGLCPADLRAAGCRDRVFAGVDLPLPPALLAELRALYATPIRQLASEFDLDLSTWLTP